MAKQDAGSYYRYCPSEGRIKLSDAVCFGRRRANYPKCRGCQFNDEEKAGGSSAQPQGVSDMISTVFKAYDVRATWPDPLNEELAWRIGHATAQFLRSSLTGYARSDPDVNTILVGRDMRTSSPSLSAALIEGIRSTGTGVIDIGMIDTSQIYFALNHLKCCGGVQTTASHNPAHYNGFKVCGLGGKPIGQNTGLQEIQRIAAAIHPHDTRAEGPIKAVDLSDEYKAFVRGVLKALPRPLKVVADASNGMAGPWFEKIYGDVPNLSLTVLNAETTGEFVHEPNPLIDANLVQLQQAVRKQKADLGVCFDGDADRLMFVNEKAAIIRCDIMTALLASVFLEKSPGSTIVYDLRSSRVVKEEIEKAGGVPRRERVGHVFMKKSLADAKGIFGGELSGHFYFQENWYCDSGMLIFAHVVNLLAGQSKPISALIQPLLRYATSGERNFKNPDKDGTIRALAETHADAEVDFLDGVTVQYEDWWFNVRPSNTEPLLRLNVEADTPALMDAKLAELTPLLGEPVAH